MMQSEITLDEFKSRLLNWLQSVESFCFLDSCDFLPQNHAAGFGHYDFVLAVDAVAELKTNNNAFLELEHFYQKHSQDSTKPWLFGYFSYDLKNELEKLESANKDHLQFPALHFFIPKIIVLSHEGIVDVIIHDDYKNQLNKEDILHQILNTEAFESEEKEFEQIENVLLKKITKKQYINSVEKIKEKIKNGDIYEMNFCFELFRNTPIENVSGVYHKIKTNSPAPFSCYYKVDNKYLMSASMERFLTHRNNRIFSQPIKGTAPKSLIESEDQLLKDQLKESIKERAENIMIVDLVRNDLSKIAKRGTVRVDELCQIYSFSHVHQMISTISCEMQDELTWINVIKACFPMGSMTGAPKVNAMKFIDEFENTKRGLYSGTVGYIDPYGNFDFNVVIRTLQYNAISQYLSLMVGSAITAKSNAEYEFEECIVKSKALQQVLQVPQKSEV